MGLPAASLSSSNDLWASIYVNLNENYSCLQVNHAIPRQSRLGEEALVAASRARAYNPCRNRGKPRQHRPAPGCSAYKCAELQGSARSIRLRGPHKGAMIMILSRL